MVLDVTVKTLDSQNYQFQVDKSFTVEQFKNHIQSDVGVPANEQRLIFCGRVLQNDKKLSECDCNGKVIHLVRRPPPSLDSQGREQAPSAADGNNNDNNYNHRDHHDDTILFGAATVGAERNIGTLLRSIMSLQQAIYSRTLGQAQILNSMPGEGGQAGEIDRRLSNASRLLRMTVNLLRECMSRLPPTCPLLANNPSSASTSSAVTSEATTRPVITTTSSHTDLQRDDEFAAQVASGSGTGTSFTNEAPSATADDMDVTISQDTSSTSARITRLNRQSLTTDDLPQTSSGPARTITPAITTARMRNESQSSATTPREREQSDLERYLNILNCSCDIQNQFQDLFQRYRSLIDLSRRGGIIVPQADQSTSTETNETAPQQLEQDTSDRTQSRVPSNLMNEARILALYVPRIMHHISHLQHALSDFTVDMAVGRLQIAPYRRAGPWSSRRARSVQTDARRAAHSAQNGSSESRESNRDEDAENPNHVNAQNQQPINIPLEGTLTITATTVEATPYDGQPPPVFTASRPQSFPVNATIMFPSGHGQSVPFPVGQTMSIPISFGISGIPPQAGGPGGVNASAEQNQPQQAGVPQDPNTVHSYTPDISFIMNQPMAPSTGSLPTRPVASISSRVPLPFDYYLTCFSPWANYTAAARPSTNQPRSQSGQPISVPTIIPRIHVPLQAVGHPSQSPPGLGSNQQAAQGNNTRAPLEAGLTEVVSNILGSIFNPRPPTTSRAQAETQSESPSAPAAVTDQTARDQSTLQQQPSQTRASGGASRPGQDPFMEILPEMAVNAVGQILGGIFGAPMNLSRGNVQHRESDGSAYVQTQNEDSRRPVTSVMMDIDIDEGTVRSEVIRDESHATQQPEQAIPVANTTSTTTLATTPAAPVNVSPAQQQAAVERLIASIDSYRPGRNSQFQHLDQNTMFEAFSNHPEWCQVILSDYVCVQQRHDSRMTSSKGNDFSDAYLSSMRKRRK